MSNHRSRFSFSFVRVKRQEGRIKERVCNSILKSCYPFTPLKKI